MGNEGCAVSAPAYAPRVQIAVPLRPQRVAVTGLGLQGWRPFATAAAVAAVLSVGFTVWVALRIGGDQPTIVVDDLGEAVAALIAAASCGFAARRNTGRMRFTWTMFALSALSWAAGEIVWSVYQIGLGVAVPFPSAADAGFLGAVPFAIVGVFSLTGAPSRLTTRGEALLAGMIVALSLLFIAWALGLGNVYETSGQTPAAKLIGLAYPVADIVTATVLVHALRRARKAEVVRLLLVLGGLAFNAIADSAFAYLNANGSYGAIGSVLDSGWVVGYLLIALAPLWPASKPAPHETEGPITLWQLALPWIAVFAASITAITLAATDQNLDRFLTVLAGGVGILLVASHILSHRDSLSLLLNSQSAEAQLERRNSILNEILMHAPLGIARVGVDMNIIDVNPRLASLLRSDAAAISGTSIAKYLHPQEFARVFQVFQPLWNGVVDSVESDSRAIRADNSEVWLHWSATAVRNARGRIEYFLAMYEDTDAEHAATDAAAAHLAGLERLNALKSEFVSLVSHEFRTALVGISGFSEMIRDEPIAIEEAKSYAADINKESERLNRLINDMLDLDRIEAGRLTLKRQDVSLNLLLQEAVERARASSERHVIVSDLDVGQPIVNCDADRIAQVIGNLLSNAIKYSPDGGEITVASTVRDACVEVSVLDHGIGIPAEFRGRLFSRYERYEKTEGKIVGTGLGLAISRQIVEMHGGRIWVDSKPGEGADFRFTLPIGTAES